MSRSAKILAVTWDGAGNFTPERAIVRALIERGHAVYVMAHDSLQGMVEQDGASFVPLRSVHQYDSTHPISSHQEFGRTVREVFFGKGFAADISWARDRVRPDLLLVDAALVYGLVAAFHSGVPTIAMWTSLYSLVAGGPFRDLLDSRLEEINEFAQHLHVDAFASYQQLVESAPLLLVFSYRQFDSVERLAYNVLHVGPLRSSHAGISRWHRRYPERPLLLVGLSTSYQAQVPLLSQLCAALADLEVETLVTTGPAIPPGSIAAGANTSVLEFVSHDEALPQTDLLITHAGHGTVMAGIAYGVPMLCFPMGRDQPMVASRVVQLGLGSALNPHASVAEIRDAVAALLNDADIRRASTTFAHSIAHHPGREQAIAAIEKLL